MISSPAATVLLYLIRARRVPKKSNIESISLRRVYAGYIQSRYDSYDMITFNIFQRMKNFCNETDGTKRNYGKWELTSISFHWRCPRCFAQINALRYESQMHGDTKRVDHFRILEVCQRYSDLLVGNGESSQYDCSIPYRQVTWKL